jgi:hypothetical protein
MKSGPLCNFGGLSHQNTESQGKVFEVACGRTLVIRFYQRSYIDETLAECSALWECIKRCIEGKVADMDDEILYIDKKFQLKSSGSFSDKPCIYKGWVSARAARTMTRYNDHG